MPENLSPSPVVNTEAIFWTSSWPFHRNQNIFLSYRQWPRVGSTQSEDQNHNVGIWRQGDSSSFSQSTQLGELPCLGSSTHASQSTLVRRADHRTLCVCMHVKADTIRASLKGCSSATSNICTWVPAGTTHAYLTAWLSKILWENALAWHVESFGGWHISACMSLATEIHYGAVVEGYLSALIS